MIHLYLFLTNNYDLSIYFLLKIMIFGCVDAMRYPVALFLMQQMLSYWQDNMEWCWAIGSKNIERCR